MEQLEDLKNNTYIKGKPDKSGNYQVRYKGREGRDDYTTSGSGHWWNTGTTKDLEEVEYIPSSFKDLGL